MCYHLDDAKSLVDGIPQMIPQSILVGGLEDFLFFPYTGNNHQPEGNWVDQITYVSPTDSYFSEGFKPPMTNQPFFGGIDGRIWKHDINA